MTYYPSVKEVVLKNYLSLSQQNFNKKNHLFTVKPDFQTSLEALVKHIFMQENSDQVAQYLNTKFGQKAVSQFQSKHSASSVEHQFALLGLTVLYENNGPRMITFNKQFFSYRDSALRSKPCVLAQLRQQGMGFINLGSVVMTTLCLSTDSLLCEALKPSAVMCSYFFKAGQPQLILDEIIYHYLLER